MGSSYFKGRALSPLSKAVFVTLYLNYSQQSGLELTVRYAACNQTLMTTPHIVTYYSVRPLATCIITMFVHFHVVFKSFFICFKNILACRLHIGMFNFVYCVIMYS